MAKFKAVDTFTISSKPVHLAYAHAGIFVPTMYPVSRRTFKAAANPEQELKYWHKDAYASELAVAPTASNPLLTRLLQSLVEANAEPPATTANKANAMPSGQDKETRLKKRKAEGEAASAKKKVRTGNYTLPESHINTR